MRRFAPLLAAVALGACATVPATETVRLTQPKAQISLQDQQVLFWDDATRADRFRRRYPKSLMLPAVDAAVGAPKP